MNPEKALLKAILDTPSDDTPRLVYADWLEEQGDPAGLARAEFIRAQIEMETLPEGEPRRVTLGLRAEELLGEHGGAWTKGLAAWARKHAAFRRGFVADVRCTGRQFLDLGKALFRRAPVEHLRLHGVVNEKEVAADARLEQLRSLHVADTWVRRVPEFLESSRLGNLRSFGFDSGTFQNVHDLLETLCRSPAGGGLRELCLTRPEIRDNAIDILLESPLLGRLESLRLERTSVYPAPLRRLLSSPRLSRLRTLALRGCLRHGEPDAWVELLEAVLRNPALAGLSTLDLGGDMTPAELEALAAAPLLGTLDCLILESTNLRTEDVRPLPFAPAFGRGKLRVLDLSGSWTHNALDDQTVETLLSAPHLPPLTVLRLAVHNGIGDRGARLLAETNRLPHLLLVDLRYTSVGPAGTEALRRRFGTGALL
jgi:uncharacterized protein (TIGR02996 family)